MDIYGAFQLCSIGILAAPLAVQSSKTYFYDPRRNVIFFWTGLILAGLLALAVEFYRVTPNDCAFDGVSTISPKDFPYSEANTRCHMSCSEDDGPRSPLREGPSNNIGVIPIPNVLTFNAAMLLATACCIPAIISLIFTFDRILDLHWKMGNRHRHQNRSADGDLIEGANGATVGQMKGVNGMVRKLLSVIYVPLFGGAVLAILCIGEVNFFSPQVLSQTEPITSVGKLHLSPRVSLRLTHLCLGQWGPIAGTALAAIGSLYLLLTDKWEDDFETRNLQRQPTFTIQPEPDTILPITDTDAAGTETFPRLSHESGLGISMEQTPSEGQRGPSPTADPGGRRKVGQMLQKAGDYLGDAAHSKYDARAYNSSEAREFPEIPGEAQRNPELEELKRQFSRRREEVLRGEYESRGNSPGGRAESVASAEGSSSRTPEPGTPSMEVTRGRTPARRDTLEVPSPSFHGREA